MLWHCKTKNIVVLHSNDTRCAAHVNKSWLQMTLLMTQSKAQYDGYHVTMVAMYFNVQLIHVPFSTFTLFRDKRQGKIETKGPTLVRYELNIMLSSELTYQTVLIYSTSAF